MGGIETNYVIGFAEEFYTLWTYRKEEQYSTRYTANGEEHFKSGVKHIYYYLKNISKSLDKVKELYPELEIYEELRGQKNQYTYSDGYADRVEYSADILAKGKYALKPIKEIEDANYLIWYFENVENGNDSERNQNIAERLIELGYVKIDNSFFTKEKADAIAQKQIVKESILKQFETEGELIIEFTKNLDYLGYYNYNGVEIKFEEFKTMNYNGYEYSLPTINGKGKKIKNKSVKLVLKTDKIVDRYYSEEDNFIGLIVKSFEIQK